MNGAKSVGLISFFYRKLGFSNIMAMISGVKGFNIIICFLQPTGCPEFPEKAIFGARFPLHASCISEAMAACKG